MDRPLELRTKKEHVGRVKTICEKLKGHAHIATLPELPQLFGELGALVEDMWNDIEGLAGRVKKLQDAQAEAHAQRRAL